MSTYPTLKQQGMKLFLVACLVATVGGVYLGFTSETRDFRTNAQVELNRQVSGFTSYLESEIEYNNQLLNQSSE